MGGHGFNRTASEPVFAHGRASAPPPVALFAVLLAVISWPAIQFVLGDWMARDGLLLDRAGTWFGRDFTNLYLGGRLALDGVNIYDVDLYRAQLRDLGITAGQNSSYPPTVFLFGAPLSMLDYWVALGIWHIVGLALFVWGARQHVSFPWPWLFLFPATVSIPNGQYGLYTSGLWLLACAYPTVRAGVAAGLLTIKPHLGILLAVAMLVQRRWRMIAIATAVAIVLLVSAEAIFGLTRAFLGEGVHMQSRILLTETNQRYFGSMTSAYVWLRGTPWAWPAQLFFAAIALFLVAPLLRLPLPTIVFPLATATFLVLPYAFAYDMAVVLLGAANLLWRDWGRLGLPERLALVLILLACTYVVWVPVALAALLWMQRRIILAESIHRDDTGAHEEDRDHHQALQAG